MPNITEECTSMSGWFVAGWPVLFILFFFSFSGGYILHALAQAASDHRGGRDD